MIQFAVGASAVKELASVLVDLIEDPDTYRKLDAIRAFISDAIGKEIPKADFLALIEETTQGASYDGKWEVLDEDLGTRRMRWSANPGWVFLSERGAKPLFIPDK